MQKLYRCYKCKESKPAAEYYAAKTSPTRPVNNYCIACSKAQYQAKKQKYADDFQKRYALNPAKFKEASIAYRKANPSKAKLYDERQKRKRKAAMQSAAYDSSVVLTAIIEKYGNICQICMQPCDKTSTLNDPTIDHIKPLSRGGKHTWDNTQLACRSCNCKKGTSYDKSSD